MFGKTGSLHPRHGKAGASQNKIWYHDNINMIERYFIKDNQPEGWIKGRIKKG